LFLICFSGCATAFALSERWHGVTTTDWNQDPPKKVKTTIVYGGTIRDFTLLNGWVVIVSTEPDPNPNPTKNEWATLGACIGTLDILPSFVADTVLLPITVLWAMGGLILDHEEKPEAKAAEHPSK